MALLHVRAHWTDTPSPGVPQLSPAPGWAVAGGAAGYPNAPATMSFGPSAGGGPPVPPDWPSPPTGPVKQAQLYHVWVPLVRQTDLDSSGWAAGVSWGGSPPPPWPTVSGVPVNTLDEGYGSAASGFQVVRLRLFQESVPGSDFSYSVYAPSGAFVGTVTPASPGWSAWLTAAIPDGKGFWHIVIDRAAGSSVASPGLLGAPGGNAVDEPYVSTATASRASPASSSTARRSWSRHPRAASARVGVHGGLDDGYRTTRQPGGDRHGCAADHSQQIGALPARHLLPQCHGDLHGSGRRILHDDRVVRDRSGHRHGRRGALSRPVPRRRREYRPGRSVCAGRADRRDHDHCHVLPVHAGVDGTRRVAGTRTGGCVAVAHSRADRPGAHVCLRAARPAALRFDVLTATVETTGGLSGITGFRGGFNLGNFTFLATGPGVAPAVVQTPFGVPGLSAHETGHTLTVGAFGGLFGWINAVDENIPPFRRMTLAYGELIPESHFPRGGVLHVREWS